MTTNGYCPIAIVMARQSAPSLQRNPMIIQLLHKVAPKRGYRSFLRFAWNRQAQHRCLYSQKRRFKDKTLLIPARKYGLKEAVGNISF